MTSKAGLAEEPTQQQSPTHCQQQCRAHAKCRFWTFTHAGGSCRLQAIWSPLERVPPGAGSTAGSRATTCAEPQDPVAPGQYRMLDTRSHHIDKYDTVPIVERRTQCHGCSWRRSYHICELHRFDNATRYPGYKWIKQHIPNAVVAKAQLIAARFAPFVSVHVRRGDMLTDRCPNGSLSYPGLGSATDPAVVASLAEAGKGLVISTNEEDPAYMQAICAMAALATACTWLDEPEFRWENNIERFHVEKQLWKLADVVHNLRPTTRPCAVVGIRTNATRFVVDSSTLRLGDRKVTARCTDNPVARFEKIHHLLPECEVEASVVTDRGGRSDDGATAAARRAYPTTAYVLGMSGETPRIAALKRFLKRHMIELRVFAATNGSSQFAGDYETVAVAGGGQPKTAMVVNGERVFRGDPGFLTAGERGYLSTMRRLFRMLSGKRAAARSAGNWTGDTGPTLVGPPVLVVDDDVVFACAFGDRLVEALSQPRCRAGVDPHSGVPGALLLGASVWTGGTYPYRGPFVSGWKMTDAELSALNVTTSAGTTPSVDTSTCFNAHAKTFGSFAVVWHPAAFGSVLSWIDTARKPFDHIYGDLVNRDTPHVVRVSSRDWGLLSISQDASGLLSILHAVCVARRRARACCSLMLIRAIVS